MGNSQIENTMEGGDDMQNIDIRTDLAIEAREMVQERKRKRFLELKWM